MKSFSELTSASYVSNSDILAISQENSGIYSSKKTTVKEVSDFANQNFAEEYDSTSSYAVGDYCIYESVLYKCTASTTGSFDNTKWTSVVVTNEMGSGGGGTGGHTIIDENGNSMTARAGLQFVGGANVSDDAINNKTIVDVASAGGIDGVFIDAENVIQTSTTYTGSFTYTATEDCIVSLGYIVRSGVAFELKIDNVTVYDWASTYSGIGSQHLLIQLKKGQILSCTGDTQNASTYSVYGIQTGTTHSKFQPVIYSTEEREIGVWTDGKPLYEKTFIYSTGFVSGDNNLTFDLSSSAIIRHSDVKAYSGSNPVVTIGEGNEIRTVNSDYERIVINIAQATIPYIDEIVVTVQYTKKTDVAGSGSWTPQGVPAVHYSTDEHIVGTWIDGKDIWEKTVAVTTNNTTPFVLATGVSTLISSKGCIGDYSIPAPYFDSNRMYLSVLFAQTAHEVRVYSSGSNYNNLTGYVTIQYTKSS